MAKTRGSQPLRATRFSASSVSLRRIRLSALVLASSAQELSQKGCRLCRGGESERAGRGAIACLRKPQRIWDESGTIWTVSDELWAVIGSILTEFDLPRPLGSRASALVRHSIRSPSVCVAVASETSCPSDSLTTAACIASSIPGCMQAFSSRSGQCSSRVART